MLTAVCNKQNLESMLSVAQDLEIFHEESPLFLTPDGDVDRPMDVQEAMHYPITALVRAKKTGLPPDQELTWLRQRDQRTRTIMNVLIRSGRPAGEALRKALEKTDGYWDQLVPDGVPHSVSRDDDATNWPSGSSSSSPPPPPAADEDRPAKRPKQQQQQQQQGQQRKDEFDGYRLGSSVPKRKGGGTFANSGT